MSGHLSEQRPMKPICDVPAAEYVSSPPSYRIPHARALGWSRVGDFIWRELHAGKSPAEVKRMLSEYVDELEARRDR